MSGESLGLGGGAVESMGAINALKTGNVVVDMMIAMCIPVLFKLLFDLIAKLSENYKTGDLQLTIGLWWGSMNERVIEHKILQNMWGDSMAADRDTRNNVLLKAIQLYLDHKQTPFQKCRVSLISMTAQERPWWWDEDEGGSESTPAGKLKKYRLAQKAPNMLWQPVGVFGFTPPDEASKPADPRKVGVSDGKAKEEASRRYTGKSGGPAMVELRVEENEQDKGEKGEKTVQMMTYRFRSRSAQAIDAFIDDAYQWYLSELRKLEDNSRYLYEMQLGAPASSSGGDRENAGGRTYKRYKLSDEKSFNSLFFDEKDTLLAVLKHFTAKTGKYAISGYPHKLGLLLHGPPGTGKTSLIKAMAQHTGRSIVNVPLARITTNQELMDIMFDQTYMVQGEEVPIKLGFKDVIFVMEDVDAASKVVHRRDGKVTSSVTRTEAVEAPTPSSPWQLLLRSNEDVCKETVKKLMEKSPRLKEAALSSASLCAAAKRFAAPCDIGLLLDGEREAGVEEKATKAKEGLDKINESTEAAEKWLKMQATMLKGLLEAGATVDKDMEDVLLGLTGAAQPKPQLVKLVSASGYGTEAATTSAAMPAEEEEEESQGQDMSMLLGTMMSLMDSKPGGGGDGAAGGMTASPLLAAPVSNKDKLNLSGLLNVLDGVVDTPERILIMTTNHPEQLDPALIRPGRIDKKVLLGYMSPAHTVSMIKHYFQCEFTEEQRNRIRLALLGSDALGLPALNMTPAQIEQLAAEHDELEAMITALENKGRPAGLPGPAALPPTSTEPPALIRSAAEAAVAFSARPMLARAKSRVTYDA